MLHKFCTFMSATLFLLLLIVSWPHAEERDSHRSFAGSPSPPGGSDVKKETRKVRPPAVAGTFYPGSPAELRRTVAGLLDAVPAVKPEGEILAAIAPHAGYAYSGGVAAWTHKMISAADFDTLVIIGHDTYRDAVAFTCPLDYFQTPLGEFPVDLEMTTKMERFHPGIIPGLPLHARDHTVEVQLPFLQVPGRKYKIVPLLFGDPTLENCRILSEAILAAKGNRKVFVLASTDMSHYPAYDSAREIDQATLEVLRSLDAERLFTHLERQDRGHTIPNLKTAMCAKGGVGTAMFFAKGRGADHVQILRYANSGDIPAADRGRVVGYGSALIERTVPAATR